MLSYEQKEIVDKYLENPKLTKNASFCIQKDIILSKYNNNINLFPIKGQSLNEYIDYLLSYFPSRMTESGYLKECLEYLCACNHHDYVKCRGELYIVVGKRKAVNSKKIEHSIRHFISKEYLNIPNLIKREILSAPIGFTPANFYFFCDLVEFIKAHYYEEQEIPFTKEQEEYFLAHMDLQNDALFILNFAKMRKKVKHFLYENLGHFTFQTTPSQQMIVDMIIYFATTDIKTVDDLYKCKEFCEKWEFSEEAHEYDRFHQKIENLRFTIETAYKFGKINFDVYEQIFGNCNKITGVKKYVTGVANYLKDEEIIRCLKK